MWASGPDESAPETQAIKVVEQLLDAGAHIDDPGCPWPYRSHDRGRRRPIGDRRLLLARGADPSLQDRAGKRAVDLTVLTSLRERLTPR